jgi:hypothetical protein
LQRQDPARHELAELVLPSVGHPRRSFPDEWLLRWNLLESLFKVKDTGALATMLRAELERLEVAFD